MSGNAFVTITTKSHIPCVATLVSSLERVGNSADILVLLSDADEQISISGCSTVSKQELCKDSELTKAIYEKYAKQSDELRWSLKAPLILFALTAYEHVLYVDPDIHFYQNPKSLFELLKQHPLLLSPHRRPPQDKHGEMHGEFNAGCIGANRDGTQYLEWWGSACLDACEKNPVEDLWDDQRYLDVLSKQCSDHALMDETCNVGLWNMRNTAIELSNTNQGLMVNNQPLTFVHWTSQTLHAVLTGNCHFPLEISPQELEVVQKHTLNNCSVLEWNAKEYEAAVESHRKALDTKETKVLA